MFELEITEKDSKDKQVVKCGSPYCELGRSRDSIHRLRGWKVAPLHVRFEENMGGLFVEDISIGFGVEVNGRAIDRYGPLQSDDVIVIGGYRIRAHSVDPAQDESAGDEFLTTMQFRAKELSKQSLYMEWSKYVHKELFRQMDLRRLDLDDAGEEEVREKLGEIIDSIITSVHTSIPSIVEPEQLKKAVLNEAVGLGPLEDLLEDKSVSEIMVNRHDDIYIECDGKLQKSSINFSSDEAVMATIERIISPLGRRIDESSPMVDARLKDGSRVNAIIPPLALKGPCITIRKFSEKKLTTDDLLKYGSINKQMVSFLRMCVEQRKNIIVSGGTGSGKTTLLNILSNFIPSHERVVTVEDAAELKLVQPHVVALESRPPNMEGKGQVTIRDLVRNCLRMRPDRIVVGECRGGEALDMLQAMNTGHDGSITTAHANTPRDMLRRLEVMVLMAGMDLPVSAIREQVASAVDIVVQQSRFGDGTRKITCISEITGMESGTIQLNDIFIYEQQGFEAGGKVKGEYRATGRVPTFYEELRARGVDVDLTIFHSI